jgi:hypothetical protein
MQLIVSHPKTAAPVRRKDSRLPKEGQSLADVGPEDERQRADEHENGTSGDAESAHGNREVIDVARVFVDLVEHHTDRVHGELPDERDHRKQRDNERNEPESLEG